MINVVFMAPAFAMLVPGNMYVTLLIAAPCCFFVGLLVREIGRNEPK